MANYELSDFAQQDLDDIFVYGVRTWGLKQADAYYDALLEQLVEIASDPRRHPRADDILQGVRRRVFRSHAIYFEITDTHVLILGILRSQDTARLT